LTAKEAKAIGLVDKINKLSAAEAEYFQNIFLVAATMGSGTLPQSKPDKMDKMTIAELQEKFPEVYAAAKKAGADEERDRVGAWMAFIEIDAKAVSEGIKAGTVISQTQAAEFAKKIFSASAEKSLTEGSAADIQAGETGALITAAGKKTVQTAEEKTLADFTARVRAEAGLTKTK